MGEKALGLKVEVCMGQNACCIEIMEKTLINI